mgnify:CR=1 FL=1
MPGLNRKPESKQDLEVIRQSVSAKADSLPAAELIQLQYEFQRWSIYLDVPEAEVQ